MDVSTAETAPDDVPRVTVHTKEELQDALEYLTSAVEAAQEAGPLGETSATEATSMSDDGADHTASASRPGGTHWALMLGRKPCKLMTVPRSKGC